MTEIERAILRNQLALLRAAYTAECVNEEEARRRLRATEVLLFDPSAPCTCSGRRGAIRSQDTSFGMRFVCELCDRAVRNDQ